MGVKLKEISFMFDCEMELYHKGQYVGMCHEIESSHWIFNCDVRSIEVGIYIVKIDTV